MPFVPVTVRRLQGYIAEYGRLYPGAWAVFDMFRCDRGQTGFSDWPAWCWCPLAGAYAVVSGGGERKVPWELISHVPIMGALAAWRMTQGIYRYDVDLFSALWSTPLDGDLPIEVLYRLPEWCCYIEAPAELRWEDNPLWGWFVHLEYDASTGRPELRLLLDQPEMMGAILHLDQATLDRCVQAALDHSSLQLKKKGLPYQLTPSFRANFPLSLAPLVSVTLYLCSQAAEIRDARGRRKSPENPAPKKIKGGLREFAAAGPTTWEVGYRLGAALRAGLAAEQTQAGAGTHTRPRPHIRRAHWHSFWIGPRQEDHPDRKLVLRWLHPVLVAGAEDREGGGIVPTLHNVDK